MPKMPTKEEIIEKFQSLNEDDPIVEWALLYAVAGFHVFPVKRDKSPATPHGVNDCTADLEQIKRWWTENPNYSIGCAMGATCWYALDIDNNHHEGQDGTGSILTWEQKNGKLEETWSFTSGGGGTVCVFRDKEHRWPNVVEDNSVVPDVSLRGNGYYIILPPSIHPNGKRYSWDIGPGEGDLLVEKGQGSQFSKLAGEMASWSIRKQEILEIPEKVQEGSRNNTLFNLGSSLRGKGLTENEIQSALEIANKTHCVPPLPDKEVDTIVKSVMKYESGRLTTTENGVIKPTEEKKKLSTVVIPVSQIKEKEKQFLIPSFIPAGDITMLAGTGGHGKTYFWCSIAAAISVGKMTILEQGIGIPFKERTPEKVLCFSSEDSFEFVLKKRLRKNGANLDNIYHIPITDERFPEIKFNSDFLKSLIEEHKPKLCIFDPLQSFLPPNVHISDRNSVRSCLGPLLALGEKHGTSFLIVCHTNKRVLASGRDRMSDSSDLWDIARSVIMVGMTSEAGIRYASHEKSNYSILEDTTLFSIDDGIVTFKGTSEKKDRDFVEEGQQQKADDRAAPARDEAKEFILEYLKDGEKDVKDLDQAAEAMGISKPTLKRAKKELKDNKIINYRKVSGGKNKGIKWIIYAESP